MTAKQSDDAAPLRGEDSASAAAPLSRLLRGSARMISKPFVLLSPLLMLGTTLGATLGSVLALSTAAAASIAYGSINNFDTVNDTGDTCHGFEIEIDDVHSKDITYTYDYNHYGVPVITEDHTDPLHPKVFVRYQSAKKPDGTWAAFTSIPAGPITPTDGHQFTNPGLNFGGEHFGVGFYGTPTAVMYHWLKDDGAGKLVFAGAVNISTPAFTYLPAINGAAAQVQAVIVPPPPPAPPVLEFGEASWVKETRTSAHNNNKVELKDLVSDDPADPNAKNWKNGEPDEVEVGWQILQTDTTAAKGGAHGQEVGAAEGLPHGDEVITRRYDFFKYVGPIDLETGEAAADSVGPDGIHGVGVKTINGVSVDLSTVVVVGDYVGAQMAGFDAAGKIGLIDHLQDGEINAPYVARTIVVGGTAPIVTTQTGPLPAGMTFDVIAGVLSGTPTASGTFAFAIHSKDANGGDVTTNYTLKIAALDTVTTAASPSAGGTTSGDGIFHNGDSVTVLATANAGYNFLNWTAGSVVVSTSASYTFTAGASLNLTANFTPITDVTGRVTVRRGGFRYSHTTGRFVQTVTLTNTGGALTGPVSFILGGLSANAALFNRTGLTGALPSAGSPYLDIVSGSMAAGASLTVALEFTDPTKGPINYSTRVLAGPGTR